MSRRASDPLWLSVSPPALVESDHWPWRRPATQMHCKGEGDGPGEPKERALSPLAMAALDWDEEDEEDELAK